VRSLAQAIRLDRVLPGATASADQSYLAETHNVVHSLGTRNLAETHPSIVGLRLPIRSKAQALSVPSRTVTNPLQLVRGHPVRPDRLSDSRFRQNRISHRPQVGKPSTATRRTRNLPGLPAIAVSSPHQTSGIDRLSIAARQRLKVHSAGFSPTWLFFLNCGSLQDPMSHPRFPGLKPIGMLPSRVWGSSSSAEIDSIGGTDGLHTPRIALCSRCIGAPH